MPFMQGAAVLVRSAPELHFANGIALRLSHLSHWRGVRSVDDSGAAAVFGGGGEIGIHAINTALS